MLCKHEVVGSIPSGSTSDRDQGSGIRDGVGPVDPIGDVPGASVRTTGICRRALGLGRRIVRLRGGRARGIASQFFDIVKSECVRSSGSRAARRRGAVEPDGVSRFSLRSTRSGAGEWCIGDGWLDRNPSRTCEAKVFWLRREADLLAGAGLG